MCENSQGPHVSGNPFVFVNGQGNAAENFVECCLSTGESPVQISERTRALGSDKWQTLLDRDGRVVNESALRKAVFKGTISTCTCTCNKRVHFYIKVEQNN